MKSRLMGFKERYFNYSMPRWAAVGTSSALIDLLIFITLFAILNSVFIANLFSVSVSTSINYYAHHKWTFKSDQNHSRSGFKYILNLIFWWLVSTSIIKALIVFDIDPKIAKLTPLLVIAPINYFVLDIIVFKKNSRILLFKKHNK